MQSPDVQSLKGLPLTSLYFGGPEAKFELGLCAAHLARSWRDEKQ